MSKGGGMNEHHPMDRLHLALESLPQHVAAVDAAAAAGAADAQAQAEAAPVTGQTEDGD